MTELIDTCFPLKTVTRYSSDKPWVTDRFRHLIRQRQRARMSGDLVEARILRNLVNRAAPQLRQQFYQSKIASLEESSTREWWKQMKKRMGTSCEGNSDMQGLANKHTEGDMCSLVNSINEFFVSVSEDLPSRLQASHSIFDASDPLPVPAQYTISVNVTGTALANVKINKATGPDKIPPWMVKDCAQQLAGPVTSNSSLREGVLPKLWKTATVIPLPKKRPPESIDNGIIRPVVEYACPAWHTNLPKYLSYNIELIQKRCMKTIFPGCSYDAISEMTNLPPLHDRRTTLCRAYFNKMNRSNHKLNALLPGRRTVPYELRASTGLPVPSVKTNRYNNSLIPWGLSNCQNCVRT